MASTALTKTFGSASSASDRYKFTFSTWFKRGNFGSNDYLFGHQSSDGSSDFAIRIDSNALRLYDYQSSSYTIQKVTNRLFRDVGAWYHIVVKIDTTQATASDRVKIYVNGTEETSFSTDTDPSQNQSIYAFSNTGQPTVVGGRYSTSLQAGYYWDGSLAHTHCCIGYAYDASSFGETDSTTGIWKPKASPSVTYGTNGFFLKFENSGSMGLDSSGNANNFTVNGTLTQTVDTPSNNFATLNPLSPYGTSGVFTNGNTAPSDFTGDQTILGTLGVSSGKWYYEVKINGSSGERGMVGWGARDGGIVSYPGSQAYDYARYNNTTSYYNNATETQISGSSAYTTGDICGCAIDLDNNYIYWYKNGVLENSGGTAITASSTAGYYFPLVRNGNGNNIQCNFGNGYFGTTAVASAGTNAGGIGTFEYDVPTGYYALCTKQINTYG